MGIVHWLKRVLEPKDTQSSSSSPPSIPKVSSNSPVAEETPIQAEVPVAAASPTTASPIVQPSPPPATPTVISNSPVVEETLIREEIPVASAPVTVIPVVQSSPPPATRTTWISADRTVHIGSYGLPGLIYVGDSLKGISTHVTIEPCLIRPQLKLDEAKPDRTGNWISEWPSYSEIPSASRAAYLEWLAEGRCHPETPIGYIYLFFYGLERRVLRDLRRSRRDILPELRTVMAEVERLQQIYGDQGSFGEEANQFLEICRLLVPDQITSLVPPWTFEVAEMPFSLEVALGSIAATQEPLPADWALSWAMHSFPTQLRIPASRCFQEWRSWFHLEYQKTFGAGLCLEPDTDYWEETTAIYQPTSVSFGGQIKLTLPDNIPKVKNPQASLAQIMPLLETGMETLDPYSRWLGRNPDSQGSYSALLLLPPTIMSAFETPWVKAFRQWVEDGVATSGIVVVSGQDLLQRWQEQSTEKLTKSEATVLTDYLTRLGIGIEPDVKRGGKPPNANQPVVLFRLSDADPATPSDKYSMAMLLLHLSVVVVVADGEVTRAEQQRLQDYLASTPHLQNSERVRLQAHVQGLLADKLSLRGLKLKLSQLSGQRKVAIAKFLVHLAAVDGEINPQEITVLSKLYPLLGIESQTLFSHVHDMTVGSNTPSSPASPTLPKYSPPAPTIPPSLTSPDVNGLQLNRDLIHAKVSESATVSALLADVFIDDELSLPENKPEVVTGIAGLDLAHTQFLRRLSQQSKWLRQDLEPVVAELGLLLDGALEIINEAAFEQCDEPLAEGDDLIDINADVLQELLETSAS